MAAGVRTGVKSKAASLAQCRRIMRALPFLDGLHDSDIEYLASMARMREYIAGSTLFYEDDEPDAVYFLERGAVEVFKSDESGKKLPLVVLRDSGVVGEMGLLTQEPRSASVRTLSSVRVLYFDSHKISEAIEAGSPAAFRLVLGFARLVSQRLAEMDRVLFDLCQHERANPHVQQLMDTNSLSVKCS